MRREHPRPVASGTSLEVTWAAEMGQSASAGTQVYGYGLRLAFDALGPLRTAP